jgi:hypothetical protein
VDLNNIDLVPIVLFLCITYAIKLLVEARVRMHMMQASGSKELIESFLRGEQHLRRMASLRWGIVLVMEALAFCIIQYAGWTNITPGVVGLLIGSFGLGSLIFFLIARRLS